MNNREQWKQLGFRPANVLVHEKDREAVIADTAIKKYERAIAAVLDDDDRAISMFCDVNATSNVEPRCTINNHYAKGKDIDDELLSLDLKTDKGKALLFLYRRLQKALYHRAVL